MQPAGHRAVICAARWNRRTFASAVASPLPEHHDIVIVGGGPAGLALAAALAASKPISSTHKVTLLEASPLDRAASWSAPAQQYSNRVSSIAAENVRFLSDVGVWQHVDESRTRGIEEMQVWDGLSSARITFSSPSIRPEFDLSPSAELTGATRYAPMATLVENLNLQRAALRSLDKAGTVEVLDRSKVLQISRDESGWPVVEVGGDRAATSRRLRPRLLIGADGYNSPVRSYSNIGTFGWPYHAHGVVASLEVSSEGLGEGMTTAWQRFLPEGPVAFLPLSDTSASLVWSTTPAIANALKAIPLDLLPQLINAAFSTPYDALSECLARITSCHPMPAADLAEALAALGTSQATPAGTDYDPNAVSSEMFPPRITRVQPATVASFPLRLSHVDSYLGVPQDGRDMRTVLVGDAAHTVHPLAGQGLNMGLGDIRSLLRTLEQTVADGGDIGSYNSLRTYPRARYIPNHAVLSTCDHLASLYASKSRPIIWARSTGLETLNELDSLKALLMGGAGGNINGQRAGRGSGTWGVIADGIDTVRSGVGLFKGFAALAGAQLRGRLEHLAAKR